MDNILEILQVILIGVVVATFLFKNFSPEKAPENSRWPFKKIAQKVALVWKAQKHFGANAIIL